MAEAAAPGTIVLLMQLSRRAHRQAREEVIGMKVKSFVALNYLRDGAEVTQRQLGDTLMLDANNCVLLLNDLEVEGWVRRVRDPADRRRHLVEMTPEGQQALVRAEHALDTLEDAVLGALSSAERAALRELLGRASAGWSAA
jgi:DNA-binding MarR family transcriptional regulator